jgi:hypothetical protein
VQDSARGRQVRDGGQAGRLELVDLEVVGGAEDGADLLGGGEGDLLGVVSFDDLLLFDIKVGRRVREAAAEARISDVFSLQAQDASFPLLSPSAGPSPQTAA